jgi:hypothetical protein
MVSTHNRVFLSLKEELSCVIWRNMGRTVAHHAKQNKPVSERQISHVFSHIQTVDFRILLHSPDWSHTSDPPGPAFRCCGILFSIYT